MSDTTEDRLLGGKIVVRQPRHGFRVAIDTVLLAASVPARDGEMILEPGAGVGAAALMLAERVPGCQVAGLEMQADLVRLAGENIRLNGCGNRVDIMIGDLGHPPPRLALGAYDHVMMNPPFLETGTADAPADESRAAAHIEGAAGLAGWVAFAIRMLRQKGTLSLVQRADRLGDVLGELDGRAGEIVVFPLWPKRDGSPAKRVLVRARRGVSSPLRLAPGLVLHEADGSFTQEADRVLRGGALAL